MLVVEDQASQAELVIRALSRAGFAPEWERVDGEPEYLESVAASPDVVLSELSLPEFGAARALELLRERGRDIPLIVVSGTVGEEVVVGL
ncbi:MAG TPA: response regulator, partial [bacterium]|nr:response regulator [bacterium]